MSTSRSWSASGLRIDHLVERHRHEVAALHRDHRRAAAGHQVLRRAVAQVARVFHVERNRIGAAQLVADVLGGDRRLDARALAAGWSPAPSGSRRCSPRRCAGGRGVALDVLRALRDLLGATSSTSPSAITATPSRRPSLRRLMMAPASVSTIVFSRIGVGELLGDERQRGAGRLADAERQVPRLPAHRRRRNTTARWSSRPPSGS